MNLRKLVGRRLNLADSPAPDLAQHESCQPSCRRTGFTLVELLVVIGVIALLIGLLLPALAAAREESKRVKCLSNLRQMLIAVNVYADNSKGSYPPAYWYSGSGPTFAETDWDFTTTMSPSGAVTTPGLLWDAIGQTAVQQCPSFDGNSNTSGNPFTGYNYNTSTIGHGEYETIPLPAKLTDVSNTTGCALFGDGQYAAGADKFMRSPQPADDIGFFARTAGTQGFRHREATNVGYCDGHAETLRQRFTASSAGSAAAGTGFLSADNSAYLRD